MRLMLILFFTSLFTAACSNMPADVSNSTDARSSPDVRKIESVTFISASAPVPAQQRRHETLLVKSDLSTELKITDGYNAVLSEKTGTISRQQFDVLAGKLNDASYFRLKPGKASADSAGKGIDTVVISSDLGAHRFVDNSLVSFPEAIAELFTMRVELRPK